MNFSSMKPPLCKGEQDAAERGRGILIANPLNGEFTQSSIADVVENNHREEEKELELSKQSMAVDSALQIRKDHDAVSTEAEYFDMLLLLKICGVCAFFSFMQIMIPLGSGDQLNPVAFGIMQILFIPWSVVNGNISYRSSLPMVPESLTWTALIVALVSQTVLMVCFIYSTEGANYFMNITRGIGLTAYTAVMLIGMMVFAVH